MEGIKFTCILETVPEDQAVLHLFQGPDQADKSDQEFLMHLEAELPSEKEGLGGQEGAEIVVVVDRSGSMQGTPWRQVQAALGKVLELTRAQGGLRTRALAYNQNTEWVQLTGEAAIDKAVINKIRASGSTNFVAVFKELSKMFQDKSEDSSKPFFIFFMTDGLDTCNNPREIMAEKERMQAEIEKFGGEVVFNVLGFSEDHSEDFLESLTYLGTSDGSYSFVGQAEGDQALEERLVQLIQSTSSIAGRNVNIQVSSNNIRFLGDEFGESHDDVVLPAVMTRKDGRLKIATKKFVKKLDSSLPNLEVKVFEKLTGNPKPLEAQVATLTVVTLETKPKTTDHNLKRLRAALTMLTSALSEAETEEEKKKLDVWGKLVEQKFASLSLTQEDRQLASSRAVEAGLQICREVFKEGESGLSERESKLKSKAAYTSYNMMNSAPQNQRQMRKEKKGVNMWVGKTKGSRSSLQAKTMQTDFTLDDFVYEDK